MLIGNPKLTLIINNDVCATQRRNIEDFVNTIQPKPRIISFLVDC